MNAKEMKRVMRREIGIRLRGLDPHTILQESTQAAAQLRKLDAYKRAHTVAFYMHMDQGELRTDKMLEHAFQDGKRVFLPKTTPVMSSHKQFETQKSHLKMLEVPNMISVKGLEPRGKYGLKEPDEGIDSLTCGLDLVVLPGMAFTRQGDRLGHGAAYYDSFIDEHLEHVGKEPLLVGVGLSVQLMPDIPVESHDKTLHAVIIANHLYSGVDTRD